MSARLSRHVAHAGAVWIGWMLVREQSIHAAINSNSEVLRPLATL